MKKLHAILCFAVLYSVLAIWMYVFYFASILVVCFVPIIWIIVLAWGSFDIRLNLFVKAISSNSQVQDRTIALTFDDGPTLFTTQILDLLKVYDAKATFFCIGTQVEKYPDIANRILSEGHSIGNHTHTHTTKMGFLSSNDVLREVMLAEEVIIKHTQYQPTLFRPPFGVTNPNIAQALKRTKYLTIGWNIRSLDTVIEKEERIFERVKKKIRPGAIILFHDTSQKSVLALDKVLAYLQHHTYRSVPIEELLKIKGNEKAN